MSRNIQKWTRSGVCVSTCLPAPRPSFPPLFQLYSSPTLGLFGIKIVSSFNRIHSETNILSTLWYEGSSYKYQMLCDGKSRQRPKYRLWSGGIIRRGLHLWVNDMAGFLPPTSKWNAIRKTPGLKLDEEETIPDTSCWTITRFVRTR